MKVNIPYYCPIGIFKAYGWGGWGFQVDMAVLNAKKKKKKKKNVSSCFKSISSIQWNMSIKDL